MPREQTLFRLDSPRPPGQLAMTLAFPCAAMSCPSLLQSSGPGSNGKESLAVSSWGFRRQQEQNAPNGCYIPSMTQYYNIIPSQNTIHQ
eukprot:scaffold7340_cov266-Pinguiococcus_pyrenoidosus.AAC.57